MKGGRTYSRRLYDLEKVAGRIKSRYICISAEAKLDLEWWIGCASLFNGKSMIQKPTFCFSPTSDASRKGFGAHCGRDWFVGSRSDELKFYTDCGHVVPPPQDLPTEELDNINVLELYPVLHSIERWGPVFESHKVILITDNLQVLQIVKMGRSINKTCMQWLHRLFWLSVQYDLEFESDYIASKENVCADTLPRVMYPEVQGKLDELLLEVDLCCKNVLLDHFR